MGCLFAVAGPVLASEREETPDAQEPWKHLEAEDYQQTWKPYPGTPADFYEGREPHGALLRTYGRSRRARSARS